MFKKDTRAVCFYNSICAVEFHLLTFNENLSEVLMAFQLESKAPEESACGKCSNVLMLVLMA